MPIVAEFLGISHLTNYIDFSMELAKQYNNLKCIIITRGADGAYALDCKTGKKLSGIRRKRWRGGLPQEAENRRRKSFDFRCLFLFLYLVEHAGEAAGGTHGEICAVGARHDERSEIIAVLIGQIVCVELGLVFYAALKKIKFQIYSALALRVVEHGGVPALAASPRKCGEPADLAALEHMRLVPDDRQRSHKPVEPMSLEYRRILADG